MCLLVFISYALSKIIAFTGGFVLGQVFYYCLLEEIPFPGRSGVIISLTLSTLLGLFNMLCKLFRCIYVLKFPMYCGKPGRGALKAMILTYIVTGPITNMGLNAREVVRVFACSTQLSFNLSREKYALRLGSVRAATAAATNQLDDIKNAFRTMAAIIEPLEEEIEDRSETEHIQFENNFIDDLFARKHRSDEVEAKYIAIYPNGSIDYESLYRKKMQYRCEEQLSRASAVCVQRFTKVYLDCCKLVPRCADHVVCWPLMQRDVCDIRTELAKRSDGERVCEPPANPGLGQKIMALKNIKSEFVDKLNNVNLETKLKDEYELVDLQYAKETAERVQQAFEEKTVIMHLVLTVMNICIALLFLRIFKAAVKYHDLYLTSIDYDNVYITDYFKRLDARRRNSNKYTLLPLKKMELYKYIDVYSLSYKESQRNNLMLHILKVLLEVVTATTFVMLDRLFYEALEVVRQHAEMDVHHQGTRDLDIQVEGTGFLAATLRAYLTDLNAPHPDRHVSNSECLPHPRQMPCIYFLKIYGGYVWVVILLFANPYTMRLKRLLEII